MKNKTIIVLLIFLLITVIRLYSDHNNKEVEMVDKGAYTSSSEDVFRGYPLATSTSLKVTPKEKANDPEVSVNTSFTAKVNGKTVEVPLKETDNTTTADNMLVVQQTVDVTPLVEEAIPKWSIGAGVGLHNDDLYYPISLQRDYEIDKGVCISVHLNDDFKGIKGMEIQHIWKF